MASLTQWTWVWVSSRSWWRTGKPGVLQSTGSQRDRHDRVTKLIYGCESSAIKKAEHRRIDSFELWCWKRLLRIPWTARRSKQSNPKGNQSWIFIGRTDAEAEAPILWPHDLKSWLIRKDPDAGKDLRKEKGTTEDDIVGWHHQLNGPEFEQAPQRVGEWQESLAWCSPWGHKEWDATEQLNNRKLTQHSKRSILQLVFFKC